ncbi:MAG: hypothetical protein RR293_06295, partial [Bacteroidales bacterium]
QVNIVSKIKCRITKIHWLLSVDFCYLPYFVDSSISIVLERAQEVIALFEGVYGRCPAQVGMDGVAEDR